MNHWTPQILRNKQQYSQSGLLCINIWSHKIGDSCKDWGFCTALNVQYYTHSESGDRRSLPVGLGTPTTLTRNWARSCSRATTWWGTLMNSGGEPFSSEISEIIHPETFRHVCMTNLRWGGGAGRATVDTATCMQWEPVLSHFSMRMWGHLPLHT